MFPFIFNKLLNFTNVIGVDDHLSAISPAKISMQVLLTIELPAQDKLAFIQDSPELSD